MISHRGPERHLDTPRPPGQPQTIAPFAPIAVPPHPGHPLGEQSTRDQVAPCAANVNDRRPVAGANAEAVSLAIGAGPPTSWSSRDHAEVRQPEPDLLSAQMGPRTQGPAGSDLHGRPPR